MLAMLSSALTYIDIQDVSGKYSDPTAFKAALQQVAGLLGMLGSSGE